MKIGVLLGGTSAERDVSLVSGIAVARALEEVGHTVQAIDCAYGKRIIDFHTMGDSGIIRLNPSEIERKKKELDRNIFNTIHYLMKEKVEVVFNALHGGYGEDGRISALLEMAGIPYTGSGPLASALGIDKHLSKVLFRASHIPTAEWITLSSPDEADSGKVESLGFPLVVKPNNQGSTVGLTIIQNRKALLPALEKAFQYSQKAVVEEYIPGREITVAVLGEEPLPVIEIIPQGGFYDYEAKYQTGKTSYEVPAKLPPELTVSIQQASLEAFRSLGCRGYGRVDLRLRDDNRFFCLEVNTLPGLTPTSLVPKAAKAVGISFNELVERIVDLAVV